MAARIFLIKKEQGLRRTNKVKGDNHGYYPHVFHELTYVILSVNFRVMFQ